MGNFVFCFVLLLSVPAAFTISVICLCRLLLSRLGVCVCHPLFSYFPDSRRSQTKAVVFKIERSETAALNPALMAIGAGLFGFGGAIFYLLPLSLLSFNLTLLFNIFLGTCNALLHVSVFPFIYLHISLP